MDPQVSLPDQHWYMFQADLMPLFLGSFRQNIVGIAGDFPLALSERRWRKRGEMGKLVGVMYGQYRDAIVVRWRFACS